MDEFKSLGNPSFLYKFVRDLVFEISAVEHSLKIYEGELHDDVFDSPDFVEMIEELTFSSGVKIQIVVGPVITKGGDKDSPSVIGLAKRGIVELYSRPTRGRFNHFWIIDDNLIYSQQHHRPVEPHHSRLPFKKIYPSAEEFNQYKIEFQQFARMKNLSLLPENDFLILPRDYIFRAAEVAQRKGINYDDLTKKELEEFVVGVIKKDQQIEDESLKELSKYLKKEWTKSS